MSQISKMVELAKKLTEAEEQVTLIKLEMEQMMGIRVVKPQTNIRKESYYTKKKKSHGLRGYWAKFTPEGRQQEVQRRQQLGQQRRQNV
jgi:2-keto-4-pentenoate hydratase